MNLVASGSEDVEDEVRALVELLLVPVVPAVRMAEKTKDAVSAVVVSIIRALNLRNDSLFAGVAIPPVVEPVVLEPVARNLRGHVRPVQVIRPVLACAEFTPPKPRSAAARVSALIVEPRDTFHLHVGKPFPNQAKHATRFELARDSHGFFFPSRDWLCLMNRLAAKCLISRRTDRSLAP